MRRLARVFCVTSSIALTWPSVLVASDIHVPADYSTIEFHHGLRRPITTSFPSGHATAAFCAATLLGGGPVWYGAAAAVASTRIYVRLHHASDVVVGAALGLGLGLAFRGFVNGALVRNGE